MNSLKHYLAEEVGIDHADGLITRREALRRLGLLGLGAAAASSLLAACARDDGGTATSPSPSPSGTAEESPRASVPAEDITYPGEGRELRGALATAAEATGAVLVVHENRGLTEHIRSVAGRLAGDGYTALAVDLLSEEGGTAAVGGEAEAMAALSEAPDERLIADLKSSLTELARRAPDLDLAAVGFCFGGGMVWRLLASGEPRLSAAVPFYGPAPDDADFSGSPNAAVLAIYAEQDDRVNASRDTAEAALEQAGLTHEIVTFPDVDHAFFNDSGQRYNADAAAQAYGRMLHWFETHLG